MQCERARELLSRILDGELSAEERRAWRRTSRAADPIAAQADDFGASAGRSRTGREPTKALALRVRPTSHAGGRRGGADGFPARQADCWSHCVHDT
jgi:hypothetical protein